MYSTQITDNDGLLLNYNMIFEIFRNKGDIPQPK